MKVAIYSRGNNHELRDELEELVLRLTTNNIEVLIHYSLAEFINPVGNSLIDFFSGHEDLNKTVDFLISLGGDGTILDTVTLVRNKNIPILGINYGRLGFLAGISKHELGIAVDALVNRTFVIDKRSLIHLESDAKLFGDAPFGLNEFSLHKRDISPMIKINTYLNGEFLNTYWCDGLIVATPTGSTGYNMSCNGPIVFPETGSFIITPVAPHNLNVRPIVIPDSYVISFEVESRSDEFICAMDARREMVHKDVQLAVRKERFSINLVRLNENNFLSTLHTKLTWGLDKRN